MMLTDHASTPATVRTGCTLEFLFGFCQHRSPSYGSYFHVLRLACLTSARREVLWLTVGSLWTLSCWVPPPCGEKFKRICINMGTFIGHQPSCFCRSVIRRLKYSSVGNHIFTNPRPSHRLVTISGHQSAGEDVWSRKYWGGHPRHQTRQGRPFLARCRTQWVEAEQW